MTEDAIPSTPLLPGMRFFARIDVEVDSPIEVGETLDGVRRIIPILRGTVAGPEIHGTVLPGGADFQLLRSETLTELEAKYAIETDDGARIYVTNVGIRSGTPDDIGRLNRGEQVDPDRIYFLSTPRFRSTSPAWSWLDERLFVARGRREPRGVYLDVFVLT